MAELIAADPAGNASAAAVDEHAEPRARLGDVGLVAQLAELRFRIGRVSGTRFLGRDERR